MKTGKGPIVLSDEARDRVSEQLHACYVATIVGRLREVGTLDLAAADLPIRVVDRPIDDFRTDPSLDLARYVRDVLVDRATYLDERSFRLDFTESDFNLDDYILHGDAAEDDRPIVRLAGREGSMTVRSDGFRAAPYLALRDCCALSQLVEYATRIRSGAAAPRRPLRRRDARPERSAAGIIDRAGNNPSRSARTPFVHRAGGLPCASHSR